MTLIHDSSHFCVSYGGRGLSPRGLAFAEKQRTRRCSPPVYGAQSHVEYYSRNIPLKRPVKREGQAERHQRMIDRPIKVP